MNLLNLSIDESGKKNPRQAIFDGERFIVEFDSTAQVPKEITIGGQILSNMRVSPRPHGFNSVGIYQLSKNDTKEQFSDNDFKILITTLNDKKPLNIKNIFPDMLGNHHCINGPFDNNMNENPEYWKQWYFQRTGMDSVIRNLCYNENYIYPKIAIFDSGIEVDNKGEIVHPNLISRRDTIFLMKLDKSGISKRATRDDIIDLHGHGTHVSGIIGAPFQKCEGIIGLNPFSNMYIYKCSSEASEYCYLSEVIDSIFSFINTLNHEERAVLSINIGFNFVKNNKFPFIKDLETYIYSLFTSIEKMPNVLVVASAGNEFSEGLCFPASKSRNYPGVSRESRNNIISVGAIDISGNVAPFSNCGNNLSMVAPGKGIYATYPSLYNVKHGYPIGYSTGYAYLEGTSMAAAIVSGIASLYWSTLPSGNEIHCASAVAEALCSSCIGSSAMHNMTKYYGYGLIHAHTLFDMTEFQIYTKRRNNLLFPEDTTQKMLREVLLNLFDENSILFNEVSRIFESTNKDSFETKADNLYKLLTRFQFAFEPATFDPVAWGFMTLFDEKYKSIWNIKSVLRAFITDIDSRLDADSNVCSDEFILSQFQMFIHQCWVTNPAAVKIFLLSYFPDNMQLYFTDFNEEMVTALIRISSDENLVPITPYTPELGNKNLKCW